MEKYIRIPWPESQELMEKDWFDDECVLDTDTAADYLIPYDRYKELEQADMIENLDKMEAATAKYQQTEMLSRAIQILKDCKTMISSLQEHDQIPEEWENNSIVEDIDDYLEMI